MQFRTTAVGWLVLSLLAFQSGCSRKEPVGAAKTETGPTKTADNAAESEDAADPVAGERAKLSREDRALVEAQEWCVVTEERLGSMGPPVKLSIDGQAVFLCCKGCQRKAEGDPDKTLTKLDELKERARTDRAGRNSTSAKSDRAKSGHEQHAGGHGTGDGGEHAHGDHGPMPGGRGMVGGGMMRGGMMGDMATMRADMQDIHELLNNHEAIERTVKQLPNGVETVTTSTDPDVVPMIQKHVRAMHKRLEEKRIIRPMDPLFVAVFENADKIDLAITDLPDGVKVVESSQDAYVVRLIHAHAAAVDRFVAEGMAAMPKTTPAPERGATAPESSPTRERGEAGTREQRDERGGEHGRVRWLGAMRNVMQKGDLSGHADLERLADLPHLYALGPLEGLRGEVTIFDGSPFITRVDNKVADNDSGRTAGVVVDRSFRHKACFLVYAQVERWRELPVPESVTTLGALEEFIAVSSRARLDATAPFPFLVRGTPAATEFHIVNKTDDKPHSHDEHDKIKARFTLNSQPVEMLGFFSDRHQGIFTHHDSRVHIHVRAADSTTGGHVDVLKLRGGMTLLLPMQPDEE